MPKSPFLIGDRVQANGLWHNERGRNISRTERQVLENHNLFMSGTVTSTNSWITTVAYDDGTRRSWSNGYLEHAFPP